MTKRCRRNANRRMKPTALSLYSGAGGLDLGLETAGFRIRLCVEIDDDARNTIKNNRPRWKLAEPGNIHKLSPEELLVQADLEPKELTLLAGGPPCQPFSKSGYWVNGDSKRLKDPRADTLAAYLRALKVLLPEVFLLENVNGLVFRGKDEGLRFLRRKLRQVNRVHGTDYVPQIIRINSVDYGVPQTRERVFIIAHRDGKQLELPAATYFPTDGAKNLPKNVEPYRTAWDAIGDLDDKVWPEELDATGKWAALLPSVPEGQNYQWHTPRSGGEPLFGWRTRFWSFLLKLAKNRPSWTLQAEPGPATGPFHWRSRKLSIRELCRLQTFPDNYEISGPYRSACRQLGNAVPPAIGELLGLEMRRQLFRQRVRRELKLIPERRSSCPEPEKVRRVPKVYWHFRGKHRDHPGVGKGPSAAKRLNESK